MDLRITYNSIPTYRRVFVILRERRTGARARRVEMLRRGRTGSSSGREFLWRLGDFKLVRFEAEWPDERWTRKLGMVNGAEAEDVACAV